MLLPATSFWGDRLKASGIHLAAPAIPDVLKAAKPVAFLKSRFASRAADIDRALASMARAPQAVVTCPWRAAKTFGRCFWTRQPHQCSDSCRWIHFEQK